MPRFSHLGTFADEVKCILPHVDVAANFTVSQLGKCDQHTGCCDDMAVCVFDYTGGDESCPRFPENSEGFGPAITPQQAKVG